MQNTNNEEGADKGLSKFDIHTGDVEKHLKYIEREFHDGFLLLKKYPKSVSIFGSSMAREDGEPYQKAVELSERIVRELGYAVLTGGGPGIMEAANKGAHLAGGPSVGMTISLPREHGANRYTTDTLHFRYFFSRKTMLTFAAETYVFFPGGFGTFDELFNILTLIQTGKIPTVPIILFGSTFWNEFGDFVNKKMGQEFHTIDDRDVNLFEITDSVDRILEIIKKAPISQWWRNIS